MPEEVPLKEYIDVRFSEMEKIFCAKFVSRKEVITLMLTTGALVAALIAIIIITLR